MFDVLAQRWNKGSDLPKPICSASMVTHPDGGVVLVGGQSGHIILDTLYYLGSVDAVWKRMSQHLLSPRRFHATLMVSSSLTNCSTGYKILKTDIFNNFISNSFWSGRNQIFKLF